jgi:hypothetical protein
LAFVMSRSWAVKNALPFTCVRVTVISAGMSAPSARRAVISMRWPRRGPPPVARWRARARRRGCSSEGGAKVSAMVLPVIWARL